MENEELDRLRQEDAIRHQMEDTRNSLTEKLETLEQKLVDTVQETTSAVTDTVTNVRDSVESTVASVKDSVQDTMTTVKDTMHDGVESVRDFMDVPAQTRRHPWMMLGGSLFVGYVLGNMLTEKGYSQPRRLTPPPTARSLYSSSGSNGGSNGGTREKSTVTGTMANWLSAFEPEINKLKGLAVGAALGTVREMISSNVPPALGQHLKEIIDDVTKKMGGEPIPSSDFAGCPLSSATETGGDQREALNLGDRWRK
jgi:ElaB/YqjD/DUF883 family membrane-anchored ribosome-binding protein